MIAKEKVAEVIAPELERRDLLLVDLAVNNRNRISVALDGPKGVSIEDCAFLTRMIEAAFDREVEDYDLEVASAGVGEPLKLKEQFHFNIGRSLSFLDADGEKHIGKLVSAAEDGIELEEAVMEKVKGRKKQTGFAVVKYAWEQVRTAKVQVSFK